MSKNPKPARHKIVWPTAELAHIWAHQKAPRGRNPQGNFYFEGPVIYSYGSHFPIARLMQHKGKKYVLMTTQNFSSTTTQHLWHVRGAITHMTVFRVNMPLRDRCWADYQQQIKEAWEEVLVRPIAKWFQILEFNSIMDAANSYAKFMGLKNRIKRPSNYAEQFAIAEKHHNAQIERQKIKCAKQTEQQRLAEEIVKKELEKLTPLWRAGKCLTSKLPYHHAWGTMLRLVRRNKFIESSKGVFVPVSDTPAIWERIKKCRRENKDWRRTVFHTDMKVGDYPVDEVRRDGSVKVGCHELPYTELMEVAQKLGYSHEGNPIRVPAESTAANTP
jgi:hypothetical protein